MSMSSVTFNVLGLDDRIVVEKPQGSITYKVIGRLIRRRGRDRIVNVVNLDGKFGETFRLTWRPGIGVVDANGLPFDDFNLYKCRIQ